MMTNEYIELKLIEIKNNYAYKYFVEKIIFLRFSCLYCVEVSHIRVALFRLKCNLLKNVFTIYINSFTFSIDEY